jgi:hypothetical protein
MQFPSKSESEKLILHHQHDYGLIDSNQLNLEECEESSKLDMKGAHKESYGEEMKRLFCKQNIFKRSYLLTIKRFLSGFDDKSNPLGCLDLLL